MMGSRQELTIPSVALPVSIGQKETSLKSESSDEKLLPYRQA